VAAAFQRTGHPYTAGLLASRPRLGSRGERLRVIPGQVPDAARFPAACRFHPRCPAADERCRTLDPPLETLEGGHQSRCWRAGEIAAGTLDPVTGEARARV
jgi:peptide/nickel transport system ATP-binding protein